MKRNIVLLLTFLISAFVFSQSKKIIFSYDSAGNQVVRKYCADGDCSAAKSSETKDEVVQEAQEVLIDETAEFDKSLALFPNPTKGLLTITWQQEYSNSINQIILIDVASRMHQIPHNPGDNKAYIDLSSWPMGMYIVKFYLNDGATLTKKIIKE